MNLFSKTRGRLHGNLLLCLKPDLTVHLLMHTVPPSKVMHTLNLEYPISLELHQPYRQHQEQKKAASENNALRTMLWMLQKQPSVLCPSLLISLSL